MVGFQLSGAVVQVDGVYVPVDQKVRPAQFNVSHSDVDPALRKWRRFIVLDAYHQFTVPEDMRSSLLANLHNAMHGFRCLGLNTTAVEWRRLLYQDSVPSGDRVRHEGVK